MNPGKLFSNFALIRRAMMEARADIGVHPEVACDDHAALQTLKLQYKVPMIVVSRPRDRSITRHRPANGGVAVIAWNSQVRLQLLNMDDRGVAVVRVDKPGAAALVVIAVYIPPVSSPFKGWREPVQESILRYYKNFSRSYPGRTFIVGDFNTRLGAYQERRTEDAAPGDGLGSQSALVRTLCSDLLVSPFHGRPGQGAPAACTSRHLADLSEGSAEVDYILGPNDMPADAVICHPPAVWPDFTTHRTIACTINVTGKLHPQSPATRMRPSGHIQVPSYDDGRHYDMAANALEALKALAASQAPDPESTTAEQTASLEGSYRAVLDALLGAAKVSYQARDTADAEWDEVRRDPLQVAVRRRTFKDKYGVRLPLGVVACIVAAHKARTDYVQACRRLRALDLEAQPTDLAGGGTQRAELEAQVQDLLLKANKASKERKRVVRGAIARLQHSLLSMLEHLRRRDPHSLFKALARVTPQSDTSVFDSGAGYKPDEDGHPPATVRFYEHLKEQLCSAHAAPPALETFEAADGWGQYIPSAPPEGLCSPLMWQEAYLFMYPPHHRVSSPEPCPGAGSNCQLCKQYDARLRAWDGNTHSMDTSAPSHSPKLKTSVGGGPDSFRAEMLAWARAAARGNRHETRKHMSCLLTSLLFQVMWSQSRVPASACTHRTIALIKTSKSGATMNAADPNHHRPITMGNVLMKVFAGIIAKRLTHWVVAHKVLSVEQVGFLQGKSCEDHVFAMMEAVRSNWRSGKAAYILFVDIAKAYDSVHPALLWKVLRKTGVPSALVDLLADWSSKRTTYMHVNGQDSKPLTMSQGLGQGDVLSPLLFNIFTDSMTRYVNAKAAERGYSGISVFGVTVRELKFADDSAFMANSAEELQTALDLISEWCTAFGLTISYGQHKTEAMCLPVPGTAAPALPELRLRRRHAEPPATICWTESYRYLGMPITPNLDTDAVSKAIVDKIRRAWGRFYIQSSVARRSPPALALQIFRTSVAGCCNYLLCLLRPDMKTAKAFNDIVYSVARRTLYAPPSTTHSALTAESHLLLLDDITRREWMRFGWKLQRSHNHDDIAVRIFRAAKNDRRAGCHKDARLRSWVRQAEAMGVWKHHADRIPTEPHEIARSAAIEARVIARNEWISRSVPGSRASQKHWLRDLAERTYRGGRPAGAKPRETAALDNAFYPDVPDLCNASRHATSLAIRGPGCSGGMLAYVNTQLGEESFKAVWATRGGTGSLYYWPFGRTVPEFPSLRCPLCNQEGQPDAFHVLAECSHTAMKRARAATEASSLHMVVKIAKYCLLTALPAGAQTRPEDIPRHVEQRLAEVTQQASAYSATAAGRSPAWDSSRGRMMLYKLLAVTPWGPGQPPDWQSNHNQSLGGMHIDALWEEGPLATSDELQSSLASIFDETVAKPHRLRPLANLWVRWAAEQTRHIAAAWVAATDPEAPCPVKTGHWSTTYEREPSWRRKADHSDTEGSA